MRRLTAALLLAGSLLVPALARADVVAQADKDFMNEAAQGGMAEVKMGELARTKAQSDRVKSFADQMVTDHTKANDELKSLAAQKGVTLPTDIGAEEQQIYDKLAQLSGPEFDKAYMDAMVKDHDKDVAAFEKQSKAAKDKDLKSFVQKVLPVLKDHKKMAHAGGSTKTM
jgi:putative membrane protein